MPGPRSEALTPPAGPVLALALLAVLAPALLGALASAPPPPGAGDVARLEEAARRRSVALARMEEGDYAGAAEDLEALARLLPDNVLPPVDLAICYLHLGRREEALAAVRRARELAPDNPQMLFTLARLLERDPASRTLFSEVLDDFAAAHPGDPRPYYLRARVAADEGRWGEAVAAWREALRRARENLVVMVELLAAAVQGGDAEAAADALDSIEDRLNGFEGESAEYAATIRDRLAEEDLGAARPPALVLRNLLRPTDLYQIGLPPLLGGGGAGGEMFPQLDFDPPLPKSVQGGQDIEIAFVDATRETGLGELPPAPETVPDRRTEADRLLAGGGGRLDEVVFEGGRFIARPVPLEPPLEGRFFAHDVDQDGVADLVAAAPAFGVRLHPGRAGGSFAPAVRVAAPWDGGALAGLFPVEVDHDGDLDLLLARRGAPALYLQNHGDGTWSERAAELGLAGPAEGTAGLAVADFDGDGDLDLATVHPAGPPRLLLNPRAGPFEEAGRRFGLEGAGGGYTGVAAADLDNDGRFDLLLWGREGGRALLNRGSRFEPLALPEPLASGWRRAAVADFDNDGDQDVVAVLAGGEVVFGRNRRDRFDAEETGLEAPDVESLTAGDFDADGDLDLVAAVGDGGRRFWRNEGGHRNQWVRLRLLGKHENNAKNNTQGLFTKIEVRAGDAYQTVIGRGGANHLGLGARRQADVIRVVWTNGVAQTWTSVAANRTLVEEQVLKGSCPFLYAWNGERFEFVTDLMWRSPLGMLLPDGSPAPHQSARDFVLVPGEALAPAGGELWLQVTEELWETAYVDRQELLAVDHPVEAELVVDEGVRPPPYPEVAPLHWIGRRLAPAAAEDHLGREVLAALAERDGRHVDGLPLGRYQGLTRGHYVDLTFRGVPAGERLRLLLWGWTFPTDTSINFALAQDGSRDLVPPRLEVRGEDGSFRPLAVPVGFPAGKRKAVVVELPGPLPAGELTLRLATSMQIYWDAAALAVGEPAVAPRITPLGPLAADLHYRGFSRLYRESPSGPHLFAYDQVSVEPRFRDMRGAFTRFGEVTELLAFEDDRYAVMNAGDELTVRFDASALPPLPAGWRRDWVLYTDGWVKDGDLHTAFSQTVEPLPYHAMRAYPDRPEHRYPDSPEHQEYLLRYQTREVTDQPFRDALKPRR